MNDLLFLSFLLVVALATAAAAAAKVETDRHGCAEPLPRLDVPHCSSGTSGVATINRRLVTFTAFPEALVQLCYTDRSLELTFQAREERSYLVNDTYVNNDPIWEWTVMEAFIATGEQDPTHYLEFEVAPNNVLYTAWVHNPNKDFTTNSAAFINDWASYPITSDTTRDAAAQTWTAEVSLPFSMFNVAAPAGTPWRMNFFRTFYANSTTAEQEYGAWNPNKLVSFHQTPCFGKVRLEGGDDKKAASAKCDEPDIRGKSSKSKSEKTKLAKRTRT